MTPIITRLPINLEYIDIDTSINTNIEYSVDINTGDITTIDSEFIDLNDDNTAYSLNTYTIDSNDTIYEYAQIIGNGNISQYIDDDSNDEYENCKAIPICGFTKYSDASIIGMILGGNVYSKEYICSSNTLKYLYLYSRTSLYGDMLFASCRSLIIAYISDNVDYISSYAFAYCTSLTSIELSDNISNIDSYAFAYCTSLETVKIGKEDNDNHIEIGVYAFAYCTNLESVYIMGNIDGCITDNVFTNCSSLNYLYVNKCSGIFPGNTYTLSTYTKSPFYNCGNELTIEINTADEIGSYVFYNNKNLVKFIINGNCNSAGNYAFCDCTNLESFTFSAITENIGERAFDGCESLTSDVDLSNSSVIRIGASAFRYTAIRILNLSNSSITTINGSAFEDSRLNYIYFNNCTSLTTLADEAFNCELAYVYNFSDCTSLTTLSSAFQFSNFTSIELPESLTSINDYAFYSCQRLRYISIPANVTSIASTAFNTCTQSDLVIHLSCDTDSISGAPWGATNATIVWNG